MIDITHLDDLPDDVKSELSLKKSDQDDKKLINLFKEHTTLTVNEVIIGLYRRHQIKKKRQWCISRLRELCKQNKLDKQSRDIYVIREENNYE